MSALIAPEPVATPASQPRRAASWAMSALPGPGGAARLHPRSAPAMSGTSGEGRGTERGKEPGVQEFARRERGGRVYFAFLAAFLRPPFLADFFVDFFVVLRVALRADFFEAAIGFAPSQQDFLS